MRWLWLLALFLFSNVVQAESLAERREALIKQVETAYGPSLTAEKHPALVQTLQEIFENLSLAQKKRFHPDMVPFNELRIIENSEPQAFIVTLKNPGIRELENMAFITTGLLEMLFPFSKGGSQLSRDDLFLGEIRFAGVLSHELAHPLDGFNSEQRPVPFWEKKAVKTAEEFRADAEAVLIAEDTGYPRVAILRVLEAFSTNPLFEKKKSIVAAALRTHPDEAARESMLGSLITARQYRRGEVELRFPRPTKAPFKTAIEKLKMNGHTRPFVPPKNLEEIAKRLDDLKKAPTRTPSDAFYQSLEFNRLLLWMDRYIAAFNEQTFSPEDFAAFERILEIIVEAPDYSPLGKIFEDSRFYTYENGSGDFLQATPHSEFLKTSWIYRSPRLDAILKRQIQKSPRHQYYETEKTLRDFKFLMNFLPADRAYEVMGSDFASKLSKISFAQYLRREEVPEQKRMELSLFFHRHILPLIPYSDRSALLDIGLGQFEDFLPLTHQGRSQQMRQASRMVSSDEKEIFIEIWKNASFWGSIQNLMTPESLDWQIIWRELGITEVQGRRELNEKVRAFLQTADFAETMKGLQASLKNQRRNDYAHDRRLNGKRIGQEFLDPSLIGLFRGTGNSLMNQENASGFQHMAEAFLHSNPKTSEGHYRIEIQKQIDQLAGKEAPITPEAIALIHRTAVQSLQFSGPTPFAIDRTWAEVVDASHLSHEQKRSILSEIFVAHVSTFDCLADGREATFNFRTPSTAAHGISVSNLSEDDLAVWKILKRNKVIETIHQELIQFLRIDYTGYGYPDFAQFYGPLGRAGEEIKTELHARLFESERPLPERQKLLLELTSKLFDPRMGIQVRGKSAGEYRSEDFLHGNSQKIQALKKQFVIWADQMTLSQEQALHLFKSLTALGSSVFTDEFFQNHFSDLLESPLNGDGKKLFEDLLDGKKIHSDILRLRMAKKVLMPEIEALANRTNDPRSIKAILDRLNTWIPQASLTKDRLLEDICWKFHLRGTLLHWVSDYKSHNWKSLDPMLSKLASVLTVIVAKMPQPVREDLIDYILHPERREMPSSIRNEIRSQLEEETKDFIPSIANERREEISRRADEIQLLIENALLSSQPEERVPLIGLFLSLGDDPLMDGEGAVIHLLRKFTQIAPGSTHEALIDTFINVAPKHERATDMAYLLAQASGGSAELENTYAAFGPLGFKAAQMVERWDLFGKEHSKRIRKMKTSSDPLSLSEVEEIASKTEDFSKIKEFIRPLGSASNWMAVLVELVDGRKVVMMVQRPHSKSRVDFTISLTKKFVARLSQREDIHFDHNIVEFMLGDLQIQLHEELKGLRTAEKIKSAKETFESFNADLPAGNEFWVPNLIPDLKVYDHLFFIEYADGLPFDELFAEEQKKFGPVIAKTSIQMRLRHGRGDADRHRGNFLVNPKTGKIQPIDFGWWYEWTAEDVSIWAEFLVAFAGKNADDLIKSVHQMTGVSQPLRAEIQAKIRHELSSILRRETPSSAADIRDLALEIIRVFETNSVKMLPKFKFGGMMELLTLQGEGYVGASEFQQLLLPEVMGALMRGNCLLPLRKLGPR